MLEIKEPDIEFKLPLKKSSNGNYIPFPKHIGGKNALRKLQSEKTKEGYVYLLKIEGQDIYKIGVSSNPQRRFRDIASSMPFELRLLALNKIKNPYVFEQNLIDRYSSNMIRNEWFCFDINTAKEIMIILHNQQVDECR